MSMPTKHVAMNSKQQAQIDEILRGIMKERKCAVEADLDSRLSYREKDPKDPKAASWDAYSRFMLSASTDGKYAEGHTVYISLRTMKFTVSDKPDKFALGKVAKRLAREKKRAERKAKAEAKAAEKAAKADKPAEVTVKAEVKTTVKKQPKAPPKAKVVKHDPALSTLDAAGHTTEPKA